jgi:UDP-glucose 4-epimerase
MSVLVTGGAGYIGSHTVDRLVSGGREVVVLDSMEFGHAAALPPKVVLYRGNIADRALIARIVADHDVDAVIHFAAYKAAGESMEDPERYFANNVANGIELLSALTASGVRRWVFSSTCAVYGTPDNVPVTENEPLGPESPYGESKLMFEKMLQWYDRCHGVSSVALRYFNAAGAAIDGHIGEDWKVSLNLVPIVMKAALERGPKIKVFGTDYPTPDGTAIRDYIHVDDLAEAHILALDYLEQGGASDVFNLGTGKGSSVFDVIDATERASGVKVPRELAPRRAGDPVRIFADNSKARRVLGWQPVYGIDEIVASAWHWHSTHPDGFADES